MAQFEELVMEIAMLKIRDKLQEVLLQSVMMLLFMEVSMAAETMEIFFKMLILQ